ncbi:MULTISPECIES: signal recognition particle-docking protein FtsY [unclassified Actinomyces]|uniref:signal recognition particle-docking protein FtsY n=1 Tax=unclassified Actinomyces TaxID=2609248 RepID=UPI002017F739|nr:MULTISPECIES: signal recognition particle-docking protein FtsY [unclassified Actinomyces]MCL3778615.1 signal recognition particle-docking protein FtsY [Actinomyces sp. AC-20-1]MCL3789937.1 signal recognition particle-docking protein FtsY [Actinomyces sp. 187325]MCL3792153.1 signal recognition particle-docking protein FtsY [Actinomyces sp. 186855]MCL3794889.1 signal recognition particle-docking protein FtsY [Actinomyces sp. 217892]
MDPLLYVLIAVLAVLVLAGTVVLVRRRRTGLPPAPEREQVTAAGEGPEAPEAPETSEAPEAEPAPREVPESIPGRMQRLRARLAGSGGFGRAVLSVLSRGDLTEADWEEIEDTLLTSDLGIEVTTALMEELRTQAKVLGTSDPEAIRSVLRAELLRLVDPAMDRSLNLTRPAAAEGFTGDGAPAAAVLMVGVNGTGKTTTCGKLARVLLAQEHSVVMGAADTFRAAAAEQLTTWGERVGVAVVRSDKEGADPASVAFDAAQETAARGVDVVLVDTAGRLQNKAGLMDELGKIKRVMEKIAPVGEILLVLDATTGQNGLRQAQVFSEAVGVTGIVLTKMDGTAKGGIVVTVQRELGVPVKLVGLGEGADDLAPFDPEGFVDALLA